MLYVARHGETTANVAGLICGRLDVELTKHGYLQAEKLATEVQTVDPKITQIIHSPLWRTTETARIVAEANRLPLRPDDRLLEMDFGIYDGLSNQNAEFRQARTEFATRFPQGESVLDMYARVAPLLQECLADEEQTYLLVCHGALLRAIHVYFSPLDNQSFFDFLAPNAQLLRFNTPLQ